MQEALKTLARLGIIKTQLIGRAGIHTTNEGHAAVPYSRAILDPIALLKAAIEEAVDSEVEAVVIFGSIARGEATEHSDVDLAVIAAPGWEGRIDLEVNVRARLEQRLRRPCLQPSRFEQLARKASPWCRNPA